jgi:hypothetical protein
MKASSQHVLQWNTLAMVLHMALFFPAVYVCVTLLILFSRPTTPLTSGSAISIAAVTVLLTGLAILLRNDFAVAVATRFDFEKLFFYRWAITALVGCVLGVLLLSMVVIVSVPSWALGMVWPFLGSFVGYVALVPILFYTDFFSNQGVASLCLNQACMSLDLDDFNFWFKRGIKAMIRRLKEIGVLVSGGDIIFAVNVKLLRGESIKDTVNNLAEGILRLAPTDVPSQVQSSSLYETIENLTRLTKLAGADGLQSVPPYRERISRTWDFLARSVQLIAFVLALTMAVLLYLLGGEFPLRDLIFR